MSANLTRVYPDRRRCAKCRRYLSDFDAYAGLYCSYECWGRPRPPSCVDDWPRMCRKRDKSTGRWVAKVSFATEAQARELHPKMHPYPCDHHGWHIATNALPYRGVA